MPTPLSLRIKERYMVKRADGLSQQVAADAVGISVRSTQRIDRRQLQPEGLHGLAQPTVEIGGIDIEVGVAAGFQGPVQEGLHLHVDTGIRVTSDLEIPLPAPREATKASTLRVEMPPT